MSQLQTQPQCDGGGAGRPPLGTAVGGGQPSPGRGHPFRPTSTPDEAAVSLWRWWRGLRLELARVSWPSAETTVRALGVVAIFMVIWAGYLLDLDFLLSRLL
ncbi:MAG: preprotein translocase subunit SecE [Candidatus Eremiobacteraeota bacterium]|nr:preprotein translocase subunit SecE [Candidatus Eremiobacteraeota bacterium]